MTKAELKFQVVGMWYRLTHEAMEEMNADTPIRCLLVREPDNEYDENAIKVLCVDKPWVNDPAGLHVGYLARTTAAVVAPALDERSWKYNEAWIISVDTEHGTAEMVLTKGERKAGGRKKLA